MSRSSKDKLPKPSTSRSQPLRRGSSVASAKASTSSTRGSTISAKGSTASAKAAPQESKEKKEFQLPALSVTYKPKVTTSELEKLKKKTIRRNVPPGEDLKHIKTILRTIKGQDVSVQEFISLIGPSTGDNAEVLRTVMNEDLNAFRKLARKVYDTITQDNSDVLLNQQLQLAEYYKEKKTLLHDKMMRHIEEIYMMAPKFDFDRYANEREKYLLEIFPIPEELQVEPEEMEMMKRQAAYHRLQWLRSEGERLNDENNSLKKRLNQLKRMHKDEQMKMMGMEKAAEAKKDALEATQAETFETLEMLNESLEKTMIDKEKSLRIDHDKILLEPAPPRKSKLAMKKKKSKGAIKKRPAWNEEAAKEIESRVFEGTEFAEASKIESGGGFHFSPIKSPPPRGAPSRERSPFHYSPPPQSVQSPQGAYYVSPKSAVPIVTQPQSPPSRHGRRAQGPRDTWSGFY